MEKRFLSLPVPGIQLRAAAGADTRIDISAAEGMTGYAAKFNVRSSPLGGFVETIAPGAFDGCLDDDVVALFNHDPSMVLGRASAGSLRLSIDDTGLRYDCDLAGDDISTRVASYINDGRVSQSSFGFTVAPGGDEWDEGDDGAIVRTITRVGKLYDVSPVTYPAYPDATVSLRALYDADRQQRDAAVQAIRSREAARRARELDLLRC